MLIVLFKSFSFILALGIGFFFKQFGFFSKEDYRIIQKIVLNITLPAAIINSFQSFEKNNLLFILVLIGLAYNWFLLFIAFLISKTKEKNIKIYYMLNLSGFNIGSFTMPFVQCFMGAEGVIATCMYDTGNAIMSCGGNYALTSSYVGKGGFTIKSILKKLFSSVPFDVYLIALVLAVFNFHLPETLSSLLSTTANANGFLAMLMLGLMLKLDLKKEYLKEVIQLLTIKYLLAAIAASVIYFVLPLPYLIKNVLTMAVFSPTSVLAPAHTEMSGGDLALSSFSGSVSIIISVTIMTVLAVIMPF